MFGPKLQSCELSTGAKTRVQLCVQCVSSNMARLLFGVALLALIACGAQAADSCKAFPIENCEEHTNCTVCKLELGFIEKDYCFTLATAAKLPTREFLAP